MDMGVGAFVFSSAVVSRQSRRRASNAAAAAAGAAAASAAAEEEEEKAAADAHVHGITGGGGGSAVPPSLPVVDDASGGADVSAAASAVTGKPSTASSGSSSSSSSRRRPSQQHGGDGDASGKADAAQAAVDGGTGSDTSGCRRRGGSKVVAASDGAAATATSTSGAGSSSSSRGRKRTGSAAVAGGGGKPARGAALPASSSSGSTSGNGSEEEAASGGSSDDHDAGRSAHAQAAAFQPAAAGATPCPQQQAAPAVELLAPLDSESPEVSPPTSGTGSGSPPPAAFGGVLADAARSMAGTLVAVSPLVVLGTLRLIVHSAVNYQTHVTEYGIHWSFPYTSAAVALLATSVEQACRIGMHVVTVIASTLTDGGGALPKQLWPAHWVRQASAIAYIVAGLLVGLAYQVALLRPLPAALSCPVGADAAAASGWRQHACLLPPSQAAAPLPLQELVFDAPREPGFLAQNREGLVGLIGFFALYLCGVGVGQLVIRPPLARSSSGAASPASSVADGMAVARAWRRSFLQLCFAAAASWGLVFATTVNFGAVSRRLLNLPYIVWMLAYSLTMMASLLAVDQVSMEYLEPPQAAGGPAVAAEATGSALGAASGRKEDAGEVAVAPGAAAHALYAGAPVALARWRPAWLPWPLSRVLQLAQRLFVHPRPLPDRLLSCGSLILEAANVNFLVIFITSNLLVGIPNHTMHTIDTGDAAALAVLGVYMLANSALAVALRVTGINLKVW